MSISIMYFVLVILQYAFSVLLIVSGIYENDVV